MTEPLHCLAATGTLDLSNLSLKLGDANLNEDRVYTLATAAEITGKFRDEVLPNRWRTFAQPTKVTLAYANGTGLMIRPRGGCEALIDGVPVSRRGAWADAPLTHGSVLQVGDAVLRLQLFSALSHTNRSFTPYTPVSAPNAGGWAIPPQVPPAAARAWQAPPAPVPPLQDLSAVPPSVPGPYQSDPGQVPPVAEQPGQVPRESPVPRRNRADRWKEDWSE